MPNAATPLLLMALLAAPDGPKLVNEKPVLEAWEETAAVKPLVGLGTMRLSPDRKKLLYIRSGPPPAGAASLPSGRKNVCHLVLRDLVEGKEKLLPVPAYAWEDIAIFVVRSNVFDATGGKIALAAGVDANADGIFDNRKEKMQAVVYDVATGKTTALAVVDRNVLPVFDRTGEALLIAASGGDEEKPRLYTTPLPEVKLRRLKPAGFPLCVCPTADVVALALLVREGDRRRRLILYDFRAGEQVAELPVHQRNTSLDDYRPRWTADGRHLFYLDLREEPNEADRLRREYFTRLWDRAASKQSGQVSEYVPVGPGPTPTTMVMRQRRGSRLLLRDAATNRNYLLWRPGMRTICCAGGTILYTRSTPEGKLAVYQAEIAMPPKPVEPAGLED